MALADQDGFTDAVGMQGAVDVLVVGVEAAHEADLHQLATSGPFGLDQLQRLVG